jgi:hypothetical protein
MPPRTGENPDASRPELAGEVFLGLHQAKVFLGHQQREVWRTNHEYVFGAEVGSAFSATLWLKKMGIILQLAKNNLTRRAIDVFTL